MRNLDRNWFPIVLLLNINFFQWIHSISLTSPPRNCRILPDLVGFGWIQLDLVGFGQIWSDLVGFFRIRSDLVGFGWILSDSVIRIRSDSFGRIRSDSVIRIQLDSVGFQSRVASEYSQQNSVKFENNFFRCSLYPA